MAATTENSTNPFALTPEVAHEDKEFFEEMKDRYDQTIRIGDRVDTIDGDTGIVNMLYVPSDSDEAMVDVVDVWWNELGQYNANQVWLHSEDFMYSDWGFEALADMKDVPVGAEVIVPPMFNGDGTTWEVLVSKVPFAPKPGWVDYTFETAGTFTHFDENELIVTWRLSKRGTALAAEVGAVVDADAAKAEQDREEEQNREDAGDWSGVVALEPIADTPWVENEDATLVSPSGDHIWTGKVESIRRNGDVMFVTTRNDGRAGTEVLVTQSLLDSGWQLLKGIGLFNRSVTYYEKPLPFGGVPLPPLDQQTETTAQVAAIETPIVTTEALESDEKKPGWTWDPPGARRAWAEWRALDGTARRRLAKQKSAGGDSPGDITEQTEEEAADSAGYNRVSDSDAPIVRAGTPELARAALFVDWTKLGGAPDTTFKLVTQEGGQNRSGGTAAEWLSDVWHEEVVVGKTVRKSREKLQFLSRVQFPVYNPADRDGGRQGLETLTHLVLSSKRVVALVFNYDDWDDEFLFTTRNSELLRVIRADTGAWGLLFKDTSTTGLAVETVSGAKDYLWQLLGVFRDPSVVRANKTLRDVLLDAPEDLGVRAHPPLEGPCLPVWVQIGRWMSKNHGMGQYSGEENRKSGYGHDYKARETRDQIDELLKVTGDGWVGTDGRPVTALADVAYVAQLEELPHASWTELRQLTKRNAIKLLARQSPDGKLEHDGDGFHLVPELSPLQTMLFSESVGEVLRAQKSLDEDSFWGPCFVERYLVLDSKFVDFHLIARDLVMNQPGNGKEELGGVWSPEALDIIFGHSYTTTGRSFQGGDQDDEKVEEVEHTVEWPIGMHRAIDHKRTKMGLLQLRKLQFEAMLQLTDLPRSELTTLLAGTDVQYSQAARTAKLLRLYRAMHNRLWEPPGLQLPKVSRRTIQGALGERIADRWAKIDQWVANATIAARVCNAWENNMMDFGTLFTIDPDDQTWDNCFDWLTTAYQPQPDGSPSEELTSLAPAIISEMSKDYGDNIKVEPEDPEFAARAMALMEVVSAPAMAPLEDISEVGSKTRDKARDRVLAWNEEYQLTGILRKLSMRWSDVVRKNLTGESAQMGALTRDEADLYTEAMPKVQAELRFLEKTGLKMQDIYDQLAAPLSATAGSVLRARQDELGVVPRAALVMQIAEVLRDAAPGDASGSGSSGSFMLPIAALTLLIALARRLS